MRTTDVPKHNLIYGKTINSRLKTKSKSVVFYKDNRVKAEYSANGDGLYPINIQITKDDSITERPYLFTSNAIIVNDHYPSREEWLALLTMREFRSNFNKIHWIVRHDRVKSEENYYAFEDALKALYRNKESEKLHNPNIYSSIPTIVVYDHIEYWKLRKCVDAIDKDHLIKLVHEANGFDTHRYFSINRSKKVTITAYTHPSEITGSDNILKRDYTIKSVNL